MACGLSFAASCRAGTLITSNLPEGAAIVNIDATFDGAATYSGDAPQSLWYQPINGVQLTVQPGTYQFRVINPTDASALYPALSGAQLGQIYTGWTFNSPWSENFFVFDNAAASNPSLHQLFDGALDPLVTLYGSATAAYDGTIANGYYNQIRAAPPGRAGTSPSDYTAEWVFTVPTTLLFVIPDNILGDNTGGVSVLVTAVPEPGGVTLVLCGMAGIFAIARRRA